MLEQPGKDLLERALPVAEPEAVLRRDGVELPVGELGDPREVLARALQLLDQLGSPGVLGPALLVVGVTVGPVLAVMCRSVAERTQQP